MYHLIILLLLIFFLFRKKSMVDSNDWFLKCKISFINEYVNSIMKQLNKICNKPYLYNKIYPDPNKSNCWFLEYDNLESYISNNDFLKLVQLTSFACKCNDMILLKITSPGG
jgi:hypothetical protein